MKRLTFAPELVPLILSGEKRCTWRLFDEKGLVAGDDVAFYEKGKKHPFATARLTSVREKAFKEITENDLKGHEKFSTTEKMYETYAKYYGVEVGPGSMVKVIRFEIVN